jgi:ribosomal protein S11
MTVKCSQNTPRPRSLYLLYVCCLAKIWEEVRETLCSAARVVVTISADMITTQLLQSQRLRRTLHRPLRHTHVKSVEAFVHVTLTANNTFLTVTRTKKRNLPLISKHLGHLEGVKNALIRAYHYSYFLGAGVAKYLKQLRLKVVNFVISGAARYKRAAIINSFRKFGLQLGSFVVKTRRPFNGCRFKNARRK